MIQLFLIVIILVILISTLNIKESFYVACNNINLNAINNYHDNKPCIELFFDNIDSISDAFIIIKNKHSTNDEVPLFLNITEQIKPTAAPTAAPIQPTSGCTDLNKDCVKWSNIGECDKNPDYMHQYCKKSCGKCSTAAPTTSTKNNCVYNAIRYDKQIIQLTEDIPYLQLGNTYLITLNIKSDTNYTASETLEITFKDVKLAENNLNKTNSNILNILKNKKINFII